MINCSNGVKTVDVCLAVSLGKSNMAQTQQLVKGNLPIINSKTLTHITNICKKTTHAKIMCIWPLKAVCHFGPVYITYFNTETTLDVCPRDVTELLKYDECVCVQLKGEVHW